ncbi:MAG: peptidoglycan editing factor PgeF [Acidobacteriaceae bacterium]
MDRRKDTEATGEVDDLLRSVGLGHGRRSTLAGSWQNGERRARGSPAAPKALTGPAAAQRIDLLRIPAWQRVAWLRHGFSTRAAGVSSIYSANENDCGAGAGTLNLGWTQHDLAANVAENRRRFLAEVLERSANAVATAGSEPDGPRGRLLPPCLVTLRQFHSGMVRIVETGDLAHPARLQTAGGRAVLRGDGMLTNLPGVFLGIQTADCVPVLVADVRRRAVAAFHAGWRGTLARIVQRGIGTMRLRYGSRPRDLLAAVGPSIGPCCYAVGEEVRHEFVSQFAYAPDLFSEVYDSHSVREKYPLLFLTARAPGHSNIGPQIHLNLWEANRRQLLDAGIPAHRITVLGECTACAGLGTAAGRKYFSHRAESGFTGRMMAAIGMAGD